MARSSRGGYRKPSSPAAVSGPGALSQRTDGGPSVDVKGLGYGENKAVNDLRAAAPMAPSGAPRAAGQAPRGASPQPQSPDGIFAPTDRPDEPLTAGVDWGPGAGAPAVPTFPEDPNFQLRAIAAENDHLAEYLLGLADA